MNRQNDRQQYWFSIETYIHIALKKEELLLYNPLNGGLLEYTKQDHPAIFRLIKRLRSPKNLQVAALSKRDLENPLIEGFIADCRRLFMAELIETSFSSGKPVQMMPVLAIKKDMGKMKKDPDRSVSEEAMKFLNHFAIHVNGACSQNCGICGNGYKQFVCCTKSRHELSVASLSRLLEEISGCSIRKLDILGGDIFSHSQYEAMMETIQSASPVKIFHSHFMNIANLTETNQESKLRSLVSPTSRLKLLATFPLDQAKLASVIETVTGVGIPFEVSFVIQSEEEFEQAEAVIESFGITEAGYHPVFNGSNLDFFKENIFSLKEEILESRPQSREIFGNQKINRIQFGSLTVTADGSVYANVNAPRLGRLGKDSVFTMAGKELESGKSWRKIRAHASPCKSCAFAALCPPINNYTYAIGRNDLCFKAQI